MPVGAVIIVALSHCCCPSRSTDARRPTLSAPSSARTLAYSIRGSPSIHTGYSEKCRAGGRLTLYSPFVSLAAIAFSTSYGERPPRDLTIAAVALAALRLCARPGRAILRRRTADVVRFLEL